MARIRSRSALAQGCVRICVRRRARSRGGMKNGRSCAGRGSSPTDAASPEWQSAVQAQSTPIRLVAARTFCMASTPSLGMVSRPLAAHPSALGTIVPVSPRRAQGATPDAQQQPMRQTRSHLLPVSAVAVVPKLSTPCEGPRRVSDSCRAGRRNFASRVFVGCSVSPNRSKRFGNTSSTRRVSRSTENAITKSAATPTLPSARSVDGAPAGR